MTNVQDLWADVLVVVGVALLAYGCSGFGAGGELRGDSNEGGQLHGDWSANYETADRALIVTGAVTSAVGALARGRKT